MIIHIVRAVYLVVVLAYTITYAWRYKVFESGGANALNYVTLYILVPALAALALILVDMFWRRKRLQVLSGLFFGIIAGLLIAYGAGKVVDLTGVVFGMPTTYAQTQESDEGRGYGLTDLQGGQIRKLQKQIDDLRRKMKEMIIHSAISVALR